MRRWLIYLTIFSLFFGLGGLALALTVPPMADDGQPNWWAQGLMLVASSGFVFCLTNLVLGGLRSLGPAHRLPQLLLHESLPYSIILTAAISGFLAMRLLGQGSLWQLALWCIILASLAWGWRSRHKNDDQPGRRKHHV